MANIIGQFSVKGASTTVAQFVTDKRAGRVDFLVVNQGNATIVLNASEQNQDGTGVVNLLNSAVTIAPGGTQSFSVISHKSVLTIASDSTNVNSSLIHLSAVFLGTTFQGNLSLLDSSNNRSAFSGSDIGNAPE